LQMAPMSLGGASSSASPASQPNQKPGSVPLSTSESKPEPASKPGAPHKQPDNKQADSSKTIYSLNPFDRGASRDLSKPVKQEGTGPAPKDSGPESTSPDSTNGDSA